jgi:hypothetical protein
MEVVRHDAIRDHAHAVKGLQLPHQGNKMILFLVVQHELPIYNAGHTMVKTFFYSADTSLPHFWSMDAHKCVHKNNVQ